MELNYIILRDISGSIGKSKGGIQSVSPLNMPDATTLSWDAVPVPELEFQSLDASQAADAAQEPDVMAVVPSMPMQLIEPKEIRVDNSDSNRDGGGTGGRDNTGGGDDDSGITWGLKAVRAHKSPYTGENIVVAILDTGIDPTHQAFKGVNLVRKNFTSAGDDDTHGHGTHCAGTIFGRDVDGMRIGIARNINKAVIGKVLGPGGGDSAKIAEAIQWAVKQGANVISMSLGIDFPGFVKVLEEKGYPTEMATSAALKGYLANIRLFDALAAFISASENASQPVLLVSAAGNESHREKRKDFVIPVSPPAIAKGFISVGALANGLDGYTIADFSNTNSTLVAPGVDIISAQLGGGLSSKSGTSMACPHVAGVATLWAEFLDKRGSFSATVLSNRLIGTATDNRLKSGYVPQDIGSGLVQAP